MAFVILFRMSILSRGVKRTTTTMPDVAEPLLGCGWELAEIARQRFDPVAALRQSPAFADTMAA